MTTPAVDTYSEEQRIEVLGALAACDGMPKHAAKRLAEQGTVIDWTDIRTMREQHAGTYQALASELQRTAEEAMTIAYRENTALAQRLTSNFLTDLLERQESEDGLSRDEIRAMPQIIQAITKVQQVSTDKLLSLTGRPTDGGGGNTMMEAVELLERLGVVERVKRPTLEPATDTTAEEVQP